MGAEDGNPPTFVRLLAYSTGLCLGVWIVHIVQGRVGRHPRKGTRMSTASIEAPPLLPPRIETEEEYAERIRNAIRRGIKAAEEGRVWTHEEAMRRLAPWLGD